MLLEEQTFTGHAVDYLALDGENRENNKLPPLRPTFCTSFVKSLHSFTNV